MIDHLRRYYGMPEDTPDAEVEKERYCRYLADPSGYFQKMMKDANIGVLCNEIGTPHTQPMFSKEENAYYRTLVPEEYSCEIVRIERVFDEVVSKKLPFEQYVQEFHRLLEEQIEIHHAVGLKSLVAYYSGLNVQDISDEEAKEAYETYVLAGEDEWNAKKGVHDHLVCMGLMSISNLVQKAGGNIRFKGQDITNMAPDKIVKMGIAHVPEGRRVFQGFTVYENLLSGALGNPRHTKEDVERLLEEQYALFPRLKERLKQGAGSLSGGEQQMLAIARGLMMNPDLIMLDEPSLGLAPIIIEEIFNLIFRIKESGKTVLLIEQKASLALSIADRGYVLEVGEITLTGTGKELLKDEGVKKAYLGG